MKIIVNGEQIAQDIIDQEMQKQRRQNPRLNAEQLTSLAKQSIVDWTIIRQHANRAIDAVPAALVDNEYAKMIDQHGDEKKFLKNFDLGPKDIARVKKDIAQNIKVNQFLRDLTRDIGEPAEDEIARYYEKHAKEFTLAEQIHAAHIVMRPNPAHPATAYDEMREIRQLVLDGADFASIADEHSSCQDQGGDLGWFSPGHMVEAFDAVVFSMNVGEISPVFTTEFGYHIATVYDKKAAELKPLQDVKADIIDRLKTDRGDDLIGEWVDEQKKSSDIRIEEE
ncbi:peptidylprolyl isomerase [candidate division KSB1 bacterium]|nr:peptidylprolyl isomerase [candidate division KSB1 bacterium]